MAKQVMPEAQLPARSTDIRASSEQLLKVSFFNQLKRKPSLEKFPGAVLIRHYRKGEVIFRQGEAGWTAFYALTSEDLLTLKLTQFYAATSREKIDLQEEVTVLSMRVDQLQSLEKASEAENKLRQIATIHLAVGRPSPKEKPGFFDRLRFGTRTKSDEKQTFIPIDGPRDLDYDSMQAPIYEGELFGEMSCKFRTPRSGTVVAKRDCYLLEIMRNILDQCQKDPAYKAASDERYRTHVMQRQLQQLPIFRDLTPAQVDLVRKHADLLTFEAGERIFDEHERADAVYLIRTGLVKVLKKASALLNNTAIRNWDQLVQLLKMGEKEPNSPRGKLWESLPDSTKAVLRPATSADKLSNADRTEVLFGLNDVLKDRKLPESKRLQPTFNEPDFKALVIDFPQFAKSWSDAVLRHYNRHLVEQICAGAVRRYRPRVGPEVVLSYLARGEVMGELGMLHQQPRSATCVAHGHPQEDGGNKDAGQVELVKIPAAVFGQIVAENAVVRKQLERIAAERQRQMQERADQPIWEDATSVQFSKEFEQLGLIQGQKLMLIDLDRCTRCDECVRACVNTHADGRSRLFLDGPRFGNYLVPVSCRSCLDPVCMIGCPVGSIHRGDNGQIVIEDWCIGCGLCSNQCPYGSIQMHDIGIIPEVRAHGWRYTVSTEVASESWPHPKFNDQKWAVGTGPFHFDRVFRDELSNHLKQQGSKNPVAASATLYFRYEFQLASWLLNVPSKFELEVQSLDPELAVWINGIPLTRESYKAKKHAFSIPPKPATGKARPGQPPEPAPSPTRPATDYLRVGRNVIAVKATARPESEATLLLQLRLDEVRRAPGDEGNEEVIQKLVTERAVVCDMCSSRSHQTPMCVQACPHDAAMRVDARFDFPMK
ncbi:MAG: 4Fe-4S binding protein [Planctomycetia bacterium]|nr:4Fe-4S binding protein [Planctomycetia bacterium]